jgi:hypothetical protein
MEANPGIQPGIAVLQFANPQFGSARAGRFDLQTMQLGPVSYGPVRSQ